MNMPSKFAGRYGTWCLLATTVLFLSWGVPTCVARQNPPALQMTSPADNTVVTPGQVLSITITSPANASLNPVMVIGGAPIAASDLATSLPAQVSFTVPTNAELGKYTLTAQGTQSDGTVTYSDSIDIDIERSDFPTKLAPDQQRVAFRAKGERAGLQFYATFSDGTYLDATRSTYMTYTSSDPKVAAVSNEADVTAVGKGTATITATYTLNNHTLTATVSVRVPPPVTTSTPTSLDFGNQNLGASSSSQTLAVTNVSTNEALKVGPVATIGDFSETDNCGASSPLTQGGICTVNVTFTPSAAGPRSGTVQVANSMDIVPLTVLVTGAGIGQQPTTAAITSSANPSVFGQPVALTATITPGSGTATPTGSIAFVDGANTIDTETLANSQASFTTSSLTVGTHSITASYGGDPNFLGSASAALSQVVNQASTSTTLTASVNPATVSSSISLTASVSVVAPGAGTPTGSISFQDGTNGLATVPVNASGQATFSTAALSAGNHSLSASYGGDARFKTSSGALNEQIAYAICVLYDQTRSVNSGATFPIKLYLCDGNGNDLSSSSVILHATGVSNVSSFSGPVQSPGNANPDNDFRYDATLGPSGGYIFNLGTSGLASGTFSLHFTAGADPVTHAVDFGVK